MTKNPLRQYAQRVRADLLRAAAGLPADIPQQEAALRWFMMLTALGYCEQNGFVPRQACVLPDAAGAFPNGSSPQRLREALSALSGQFPCLFAPEWIGCLPDCVTAPGGIVCRMMRNVRREDWCSGVEIVGWLYQYFVTPMREGTSSQSHKNTKVPRDRLPAETQIFTPEWMARFLAENTLGRLWLTAHPDTKLCDLWRFYAGSPDAPAKTECPPPENIRCFDPCAGAGHILVNMFDVFMQIYRAAGWQDADAAVQILRSNLAGFDLDERPLILADFALMMRAYAHCPTIFASGVRPMLYAAADPQILERAMLHLPADAAAVRDDLAQLQNDLADLPDAGSLLCPESREFAALSGYLDSIPEADAVPVGELLQQHRLLSSRWDVVCTNPPYLAASSMNPTLLRYIRTYYKIYGTDLFAAFCARCASMTNPGGMLGLLTPYVWMFLQSYEPLRTLFCVQQTVETLVQLEYSAFSEATVPVCLTVIRNAPSVRRGRYIRLSAFRGGMEVQREKTLAAVRNPACGYVYDTAASRFLHLPGKPCAYWVSEAMTRCFSYPALSTKATPRQGLATGDNARFVRLWHEVPRDRICFTAHSRADALASGAKWFPYNKGGDFRRWYGNNNYVADWYNDGAEIRSFRGKSGALRSRPQNTKYYFRPSVTWSKISSGQIAFRYKPEGHIFDVAGTSIFAEPDVLLDLLGFANSCVTQQMLRALAPTMNFEVGHIASLPLIPHPDEQEAIAELVRENIALSRSDWDAFEQSWDYVCDPVIARARKSGRLAAGYAEWESECAERFAHLRENEEQLNRIFLRIYGLSDEIDPTVPVQDVTVRLASRKREARGIISYAMGCLLGRYDASGVEPVHSGVLLMQDAPELVMQVFAQILGKEHLAENLQFLCDALGGTGHPEEWLYAYLTGGFYTDHVRRYGKRPVYLMFSDRRGLRFRALAYLHCWDAGLVQRVWEYADQTGAARYAQKLVKHFGFVPDPDAGVRANYAALSDVLAAIR